MQAAAVTSLKITLFPHCATLQSENFLIQYLTSLCGISDIQTKLVSPLLLICDREHGKCLLDSFVLYASQMHTSFIKLCSSSSCYWCELWLHSNPPVGYMTCAWWSIYFPLCEKKIELRGKAGKWNVRQLSWRMMAILWLKRWNL